MKEKRKKLSKKIIFAIVAACIVGAILIACAGLQIAFAVAHKLTCWHPDYEQIDLTDILQKQELSDEDYEILFRQTGLTQTGIDRMLEHGTAGKSKILYLQSQYFTEYEVVDALYAPFICTDFIDTDIDIIHVYLKPGDILVTSSTHFSGWRIGHAGLVTESSIYNEEGILQASAYGETSAIGTVAEFTNRINFMVLSVKTDEETKEQVVDYAVNHLIGKSYDIAAGVLTGKNKAERTQCAHLVWYAYQQFGIDLDSNGGLVVSPRDIANSPEVELVQVFGFDPDALWS